jgi:hypothetical protein
MKHKIKEGDVVTIFDLNSFRLRFGTVTLIKEAQDLYGYITQGQYHVFTLPTDSHEGGEEFVVADEEILAVNDDWWLTREELKTTLSKKLKSNDTRVPVQVLAKMLGVLLANQV